MKNKNWINKKEFEKGVFTINGNSRRSGMFLRQCYVLIKQVFINDKKVLLATYNSKLFEDKFNHNMKEFGFKIELIILDNKTSGMHKVKITHDDKSRIPEDLLN